MTELVLFHHVRGLTPGVVAFADRLRSAGHQVHTPDLFEGRTFDSVDSGIEWVQRIGFDTIIERGVRAAEQLPAEIVYAGMSLGVMPAQKLAQTRPGALGAVFLASCAPVSYFGEWPASVPVRIHAKDGDPSFVDEGDIDAARELVTKAADAELILYPGREHLFFDNSTADYDPEAAATVYRRVLDFLAR